MRRMFTPHRAVLKDGVFEGGRISVTEAARQLGISRVQLSCLTLGLLAGLHDIERAIAIGRGLAHLAQAPCNQRQLANPNSGLRPHADEFLFHRVLLSKPTTSASATEMLTVSNRERII